MLRSPDCFNLIFEVCIVGRPLAPDTRPFPHLTVGVNPLGHHPLVSPGHRAAHVVHPAVIILPCVNLAITAMNIEIEIKLTTYCEPEQS